jgi:hypothetical protein
MTGDETYDIVVVSETITVVEVEPARPALPHKLYEHFCDHPGCGKWGAFGYSRHKRQEPKWFCFGHRDDGERMLSGIRQ